jgi:hypothetical protein
MPADHGFRLDEDQCLSSVPPGSRVPQPEETIWPPQARALVRAVQDGELLSWRRVNISMKGGKAPQFGRREVFLCTLPRTQKEISPAD